MPATTPVLGLPYPTGGDPIDTAGDIQRLAMALDTGGGVPGGTVTMTIAAVAPAGWALLNGTTLTNCQTLYPETWGASPVAWRSGADLLLPNAGSRYPITADATYGLGTVGGSATRQLAAGHLPQHTHAGWTGYEDTSHFHSAVTDSQGYHGHPEQNIQAFVVTEPTNPAAYFAFSAPAGSLPIATRPRTADAGSHAHNVSTGGVSANHAHAVSTDGGPGSSTAFDITPPFIALNLMIRLR